MFRYALTNFTDKDSMLNWVDSGAMENLFEIKRFQIDIENDQVPWKGSHPPDLLPRSSASPGTTSPPRPSHTITSLISLTSTPTIGAGGNFNLIIGLYLPGTTATPTARRSSRSSGNISSRRTSVTHPKTRWGNLIAIWINFNSPDLGQGASL